mgnify:CR=1 FL=1
MSENVVVLGSGYAGAGAIKSLESHLDGRADVTWISDVDYHLVLHESHRCIRDPSVREKITIPVSEIKSRSTDFVQATVEGINVDDRTVEVDDRRFEPDYVVLASGSTVNIPALPGIEDVDYQTSADVLDTTTVPDSGVVMGFGVVGLELVSYLHEAGVEDLTVVEHDARPLDQADPAFGDAALDIYREEFDIDVLTHTVEQRVEPTAAGGVRLHVERDGTPETVEAEQLYLFTGRRPNVDSLGLDATALDPGVGWVEDTMQARDDDRVFVAGDVTGTDLLLHVAKEEGYTAAENIRRHAAGDQLNAYSHIHHQVIFSGASVYPYARVGHSEASAEAAGIDYVSATRDAASDGVFKTKATPLGLATLVVDADDGTVLGYQGLHYHADVMAKTMQVVVETEMAVTDVPDRAFHPTTPEIIDGLVRETAAEIADR